MILKTMAKDKHNYDSWSDEDIERWLKHHQTDRGNLSFSRIGPYSTWPDVIFGLMIALFIIVGLGITLFFWAADSLWSMEQILTLLYFDSWPFLAAVVFGLYTIGHRVEDISKYHGLKKVQKSRLRIANA